MQQEGWAELKVCSIPTFSVSANNDFCVQNSYAHDGQAKQDPSRDLPRPPISGGLDSAGRPITSGTYTLWLYYFCAPGIVVSRANAYQLYNRTGNLGLRTSANGDKCRAA